MTNEIVVEARDVHYSYQERIRALAGVNFSVSRWEFIGLMGQNGSGKTTLAKHLNGLLKPQLGTVFVDGIDTRKLSVAQTSRKVGYVFQNPEHQIFARTLLEEISFGLRNLGFPKGEIEERATEALRMVDLNKPLNAFPHFLSVGEKHRLAIASVIAMRPQLLILDEPTTGVDYGRAKQIMGILKRLNEQGMAVLVITHDAGLVAEYCQRVAIMREGLIVNDGNADEVLSDENVLLSNSLRPLQVTALARSLGLEVAPIRVADFVDFYIRKRAESGRQSFSDETR